MSVFWPEIDKLVQAYRQSDPSSSEESLLRQLRLWWCVKYNKPFLDPLLDKYTLQDLIFEYLTHFYLLPENDPSEKKRKEAQVKSDEDWAIEQLKKVQKPKEEEPKKEIVKPPEPPQISIPDLPEISTSFKE